MSSFHSIYDICVYGATASGILAAIAATRRGHRVILIEPSRWPGGMIGGGIRVATDCEYPLHTGGLTREMLLRERKINVWNEDGGQAELRQLWRMLIEKHRIAIVYEHRVRDVIKKGNRIDHLILEYAPPGP